VVSRGIGVKRMEQYLVNGLCWGATYAIVALGFSIAANAGRTLHLAHGAVFAATGIISCQLHNAYSWPMPVTLVGSVVAGAVLSTLVDLWVYSPIRRRVSTQTAPETLLVGAIGADAVLRGLMGASWGSESRSLGWGGGVLLEVGSAAMSLPQVCQVAAFLLTAAAAAVALRTSAGRSLRALADDPQLLSVLGYNVRLLRTTAMAASGALAGGAGFLAASDWGVDPHSGLEAVLIAAVITTACGARWVVGPMVGAILLGQLHAWMGAMLPSKWAPLLVYSILLVLLMLRPGGLFVVSSRPDSP